MPPFPGRHASFWVFARVTPLTTANAWPHDIRLANLKSAGLNVQCSVRFKLFTIDNRLVLRRSGRLGKADRGVVEKNPRFVFAL